MGLVLLIALLAVSIPFAAEGHFGILGTGFNVDMSQHLFVADGIAHPHTATPLLIRQGYPVGPHSLAATGAELTGGDLVSAFTGVTIAVPVLLALTALTATRELGPRRSLIAAPLAALPYLAASYLAQGSFKELFEAAFVVGFALWLRELGRPLRGSAVAPGPGFAVPGAVLFAGALYSYSGPGVAWLGGTLAVWALIALGRSPGAAVERLRAALPGVAVGLVLLVVLVAPEAGRIIDFGANAGNVATPSSTSSRAPTADAAVYAAAGSSDAGHGSGHSSAGFDNRLGNLFGDIPALEVFGVWPSGDFRVEAGDGAVPAPVFYVGALLGAAALGFGLRRALARDETALLAALAASVVIWLAALLFSTPYTTAKALQMVAPVLMLIALLGVLDGRFSPLRPRPGAGTALAAAFVLAAAGSSALALANAPVGPRHYTADIASLRGRVAGIPTLLLAPAAQITDQHAGEFYGWELRGAQPICVAAIPEVGAYDRKTPPGIDLVVTTGSLREAPFTDVHKLRTVHKYELWEVNGAPGSATADRPGSGPADELQPGARGRLARGRLLGRARAAVEAAEALGGEDRVAADRRRQQALGAIVLRGEHAAREDRVAVVAPVQRRDADHVALARGPQVVDRDIDRCDPLAALARLPQDGAHAVVDHRVADAAGEQAGRVEQLRADREPHAVGRLPAQPDPAAEPVDSGHRLLACLHPAADCIPRGVQWAVQERSPGNGECLASVG